MARETKSAFKTTEMIAFVAAVVVVAVMSLLVKKTEHADYFRADKAMFYTVLLTLGYQPRAGQGRQPRSQRRRAR